MHVHYICHALKPIVQVHINTSDRRMSLRRFEQRPGPRLSYDHGHWRNAPQTVRTARRWILYSLVHSPAVGRPSYSTYCASGSSSSSRRRCFAQVTLQKCGMYLRFKRRIRRSGRGRIGRRHGSFCWSWEIREQRQNHNLHLESQLAISISK